jgi:hypothetical protein
MVAQSGTLRPDGAALYLHLAKSTLAKMRINGNGPRYVKAGKRVVLYDIKDLDEWLAGRKFGSTSEYED